MFFRTSFMLAMLSTAAMGAFIQNVGSEDYVSSGVVLDHSNSVDWVELCQGECRFNYGGLYIYDDGSNGVVGNPQEGTFWTIETVSSADTRQTYQVKNEEGRCWTQRGNEIFLSPCIPQDTRQEWYIY